MALPISFHYAFHSFRVPPDGWLFLSSYPVGAGLFGLVLALALHQLGILVKIVNKASTPRVGQRGPGIQPRTQELFQTLDVLDDADAIILGQDVLEGVHRTALKEKYSCEVEFGTRLVSLTQDAEGVDVVIAKGDTVLGQEDTQRFDFLVGADGARGIVRKQLGLAFLGESRPSFKFIIADVRVEGIDENHWHIWGDSRPTGLFELVVTLADSNIDYETVMKTIPTITGRTDLNVTEVVPNIRMTDTFSAGRCFLVGAREANI
ncbi:hypothetical protein B0H14DRAFT_3093089 [Mycena olivaceomarginata]|nr:hypothetical protein B0H14DRAFT_3093089 [Mycena olivaceomarginata]